MVIKRTACAAMEAFLELNDYELTLSDEEEYQLVIEVAQGNMTRDEISTFLERCVQKN